MMRDRVLLMASFFQNSYSRGLITLLLCLTSSLALGQVKVQAGFLSDSVRIGEETAFYLSARYPESANALFPDSIHSFAPFEFQRKKYFATDTENGISRDSTIYYVSTFEIDAMQGLDLPVYVVNEQDCTEYRSNADSIRLIQLVGAVPDSIPIAQLPLRINVAYHPVDYAINYVVLSVVAGVLVVLAVIVWLLFGKRIARHFRARKLRRYHKNFVETYERLSREALESNVSSKTENALSLWKKYLEGLESKPYTKLTSRETVRALNDQSLGRDLSLIDRAIYGHADRVAEPLERLRSVADARFKLKLQEVMHGK